MIQSWLAALSLLMSLTGGSAAFGATETTYYAEDLLKPRPFWTRAKLYKKISQDKEILVSTIEVDKGRQSHWEMKGVGIAKVPIQVAWDYVRDFEKLRKAPRHFKRISYNKESQLLTLRLELLGLEREIIAHVQEHDVGPEEKHLHWFNREGLYAGLEGVIVLKKKSKTTTEISEFSKYSRDELKLPGWVFSFVTEAVMKHVAYALRKDLESTHSVKRASQ